MIQIGLHSGGRLKVSTDHPYAVDALAVTPEDLAFGLSHVTRFGGMAGPYCPTPESRILTDDLRWIAAEELKVGQGLLAFDEEARVPGQSGHKRRRWRPAKVVACGFVKRPIVRLYLSDGTVLSAAEEHPWLVRSKVSGNTSWQTAGAIRDALKRGTRYMPRYLKTWGTDDSREGGWLAGIFDGEGHVSFAARSNRGGVVAGIAQNPGLVLDEINRLLRTKHVGATCIKPKGNNRCIAVQLSGGWRELARTLGTIRPIRLLDRFRQSLWADKFGKQFDSYATPLQVTHAENVGEGWVVGMETTTHTYLCEGFGAHNSVGEHTVRIFDWAKQDGQDKAVLRAILIHDAPECLGEGDHQRFVKRRFFGDGPAQYAGLICRALWERFCPPSRPHDRWSWHDMHDALKPYDEWIGSVEARAFGFPHEPLPEWLTVPGCAVPLFPVPYEAEWWEQQYMRAWRESE